MPGRLLHVPRGGHPARRRPARRPARDRLAAPLPAGALEGHVAGAVRRPAAPGAPGRLDLPGAARRGARPGRPRGPAHSRRRRAAAGDARMRHDVIVVGTGVAGLAAGVRLAQEGARVLVLAKGIGATHLAGATVDVLGYDPARVESPDEAIGRLASAQPGHPYARLGAAAVGEALA